MTRTLPIIDNGQTHPVSLDKLVIQDFYIKASISPGFKGYEVSIYTVNKQEKGRGLKIEKNLDYSTLEKAREGLNQIDDLLKKGKYRLEFDGNDMRIEFLE